MLVLLAMGAAVIFGSTMQISGVDKGRDHLWFNNNSETIYVWYADENMTDFLSAAAVAYGDMKKVRVIPVLASDSEYLEAINNASLNRASINKASVKNEQTPDLFLLSNDSLGKAYLAGLACEVYDNQGVLNGSNFSDTALDAITYNGKKIGYPLYFETSALVYNETYLKEWASQQATKKLEGTDESEELDEEESSSSIVIDMSAMEGMDEAQKLEYLTEQYFINGVPKTVDGILNVADTFDAPEGVEVVMEWDVSDIFYNYWFVGNYMIVGGDAGDDYSLLNVSNEETTKCLETYAELNQFFSIQSDTTTYESVVDNFINGKNFFTVGTSDIIKTLEASKASGDMVFDYGIATMPAVSQELESRSMSVTEVVVINGYSSHKATADDFAKYLTCDCAADVYTKTGNISANKNVEYSNKAVEVFLEEYADSIPLPKLLETENYWMQAEVLFAKIWNGADVTTTLNELHNQLVVQFGN